MSCGYNAENKNKETFVLEHMRRSCDAISKNIIAYERKVKYWGFGHKSIFTLMPLGGIFVHFLSKKSNDIMLLVIL